MQFLVMNKMVECSACGTLLDLIREQDKRVGIMKHAGLKSCPCYNKQYRVDRRTGYAEEMYEEPAKV